MNPPIPYLCRKTAPLRGTVASTEVKLDHASKLAIAYARHWLKAGPGAASVDFLISGVVRRSLAVYMQHLADPAIDPAAEVRAVRDCCTRRSPGEDNQAEALRRLAAAPAGSPMPSFASLLRGTGGAVDVAAICEHAEALAEAQR